MSPISILQKLLCQPVGVVWPFGTLYLCNSELLIVRWVYVGHTHIQTYIHTHIHTYLHINAYIHTYLHTHTYTYTHTYIHTHTHTHIYTYTHAYIHTHAHIYIHTYTYIHTYLHAYTHIHTYTSAQREVLKQQIGTWPASKEDLITKHKKEFCASIESIDFDNLKV